MRGRIARGVTLVELMVVLTVMGVVVTFAAPAWQEFVARQRRELLANQLTGHMSLARSMAISRGKTVALSPVAQGWQTGWRVHFELQRNGQWDEGEPVLAEHAGDPKALLTGNGPMRRYVMFDPDGRPTQVNGGFLAGSLSVCVPSQRGVVALVMSATGRVRQERREAACGP